MPAASRGIETQGEEIIATARDVAWQLWPEKLLAAYALGSLAHGGFSAVSDVDFALVLADPLIAADAQAIARLGESVRATSKPFADRLSVFWGSPATLGGTAQGGRFPPLDRLDLVRYGRLLTGTDVRAKLPVPTRRELVIAGAEFALARLATEEAIAKLRDPQTLLDCDAKSLTKLILYPVRFLFTARTGEVGRNDAAVAHFAATRNREASALARLALQWRDAAPSPSDGEARAAIAAGALAIYGEFLRDHETRLREYQRPELARAFARWREKLQA